MIELNVSNLIINNFIKSDNKDIYKSILFKLANQHIRMISEGSCDIEDWNNSCWKCSFAIKGINTV